MLAYISFAIDKGTCAKVQNATVGLFSIDEIVDAKNELWAVSGNHLHEKQNRKTLSLRTEKEAHAEDIIEALKKLNEENHMPRILIDAKDLDKIPRSHPEELNDVSLADRLNQLEQKMSDHGKVLDTYIAQNIVLGDRIEELEKGKKPSYATIAAVEKPQPPVPSIEVTKPSAPPAPLPRREFAPNPACGFPFGRGRASSCGAYYNDGLRPGALFF